MVWKLHNYVTPGVANGVVNSCKPAGLDPI